MTGSKVKEASAKTEEGLPREAVAIVGDPEHPETWKLPHHTKVIFRARSRLNIEKTVDWEQVNAAVAALSPSGYYRLRAVEASPEDIIEAARHLAEHYRKAGRPLPDTIAALV